MAIACAFTAWQPNIEEAAILELLAASFVFMCWALWGIVSGPWRLRLWWFCLASLLNLGAGFFIFVSDRPFSKPIGILFLGYSLWQFFVFRRPAPKKWGTDV
jgi:hypothetical protein